jgi:hypothetical protein
MTTGHGYLGKYDYVDLLVEQRGEEWTLTLRDRRHGESVEHDETFATADEAKGAALAAAQHHINVQHNDTLLTHAEISWQEYGR